VSEDQMVRLYPLTFVAEAEGVGIGRFGTDFYAVFPEDGAELVKRLQMGLTLAEAAAWYESVYGEEVDMEDFVNMLRDMHFLHEHDAESSTRERISGQRLGRVVFSPVAWFLYAVLAVWCAVDMVQDPQLRPHYSSLFFSPSLLVMEIVLFVGQLPGLFLHEGMHLLAGRRRGIPTRLGIGRRMYFIVLESSMPGIWGLPRKERYLPLLAGMLGDVVWFSLLTLVAGWLLPNTGWLHIIGEVCRAFAFTTMLRFIWQFYFYLQTDVYYVLLIALRCVDLQRTTREYLHNAWHRLRGAHHRVTDESKWSSRDRLVARWYAPVYVIGWLVTAGMLVFVGIPVMWKIFTRVIMQMREGSTMSHWDALVFLSLNLLQYGIAFYLYLKKRRANKQNGRTLQASFSKEG
jgi:hypothetical protein